MSKCRLRLGLLSLAVCLPAAAQAPAIAPNGILNAADYIRNIAARRHNRIAFFQMSPG